MAAVLGYLLEEHVIQFAPAALDATETKSIIAVNAGDVVLYAYAVILQAAATTTDSTIEVGDGGDPNRFIDQIDTETNAAQDLIQGVTGAFPYVYLVDDTVDVVYTDNGTPGGTFPTVRVIVGLVRSTGSN